MIKDGLYSKVVQFVDDSFEQKQKSHFERTVFWFDQFFPNYTEAHRIAAYAHDIERAFRNKANSVPGDYRDKGFLKKHQEGGANIMLKFLETSGASKETVDTVVHLISKHEEGGDVEQDALMEADSVSFFETNAEMFVTKKAPIEGKQKVKEKLDWMFNRIKSEQARKIAGPNYQKWVGLLE